MATLVLGTPGIAGAAKNPFGTTTCTYVELGAAGPPGNELVIHTTSFFGELALSREGTRIVVTNVFGGSEVACLNGSPTVDNVDQIRFTGGRKAFPTAEVMADVLAPGATPEADGTSELEISMDHRRGFLSIRGGDGPDQITVGTDISGHTRANLNAGEAIPDLDVDVRGSLDLSGGGGADNLQVGGAGVADLAFASLRGGPGDDVLVGGGESDFLDGSGGRDRVIGGKGPDFLIGRDGGDTIVAGSGRDIVYTSGGGGARINCGASKDIAGVDRSDREKSCERVVRVSSFGDFFETAFKNEKEIIQVVGKVSANR